MTGQFRDGDVRAALTEIEAASRELAYEAKWSLGRNRSPRIVIGRRPMILLGAR